jgi:hypothetical protein
MASLANAFGALNAIGSGQAPTGAAKKKKNKAKKPAAADEGPAAAAPAPAAAGQSVVEVGEAVPVLDKAARTFKAGSDRLKLWKDWIKQVGGGGRGAGRPRALPARSVRPPRRPRAPPRRPATAPRAPSPMSTPTPASWTSSRWARGRRQVAGAGAARRGARPRAHAPHGTIAARDGRGRAGRGAPIGRVHSHGGPRAAPIAAAPAALECPWARAPPPTDRRRRRRRPPSQVMLRSRALEITMEGCLSSPLPADHVPELAKLLAAFLPRPAAAGPLAAAVARLAALLADDVQSYDTLGAAQRAAATLVGSLKSERPPEPGAAAAPLARLAKLDSDMAKEQGFLSKVSQGGVTK